MKTGGINKKFHINALKMDAINTGIMSNNIARIDTDINNIRATVLYSKIERLKKQIMEPKKTILTLIRDCERIDNFLVL